MKIDYSPSLFREIANLALDEIVQVENRKGIKTTIHVRDITKLSWHELQLLMPEGSDSFTKKALLYRRYLKAEEGDTDPMRGQKLNIAETEEINEYLKIYRDNSFSKHFEVNRYITSNDLWQKFPTIRSLNDHGENKDIPGIEPKYFSAICQLLEISGEDGAPLQSYRKY
ncbi:MAG: hypothetical protein KGZ70_10795 [Hydrogenophaga sp.]|nr:hypothetical protein [Hydrogenophaga sp.]